MNTKQMMRTKGAPHAAYGQGREDCPGSTVSGRMPAQKGAPHAAYGQGREDCPGSTVSGRMPAQKEKAMIHEVNSDLEGSPLRGLTGRVALTTFALLMVGPATLLAGSSSQTTFASPEDASRALFTAVQNHDQRAETKILGAGSELLSSDDKMQDTLDRERFVLKYQEMHRLVREPAGVTALYIGAENWPFPIPLVSRAGVWRFDPDNGANEIRFRRIGENEVTAIGICHALVVAETHPGTDSEADRLVKTVLPDLQHANKPVQFHGYYYRILSESGGGFAAIAFPVQYRISGVVSFIVNHDDIIYEKDLGPNTTSVARATHHSDPTWAPAESMP
jgi:hypothetical protein